MMNMNNYTPNDIFFSRQRDIMNFYNNLDPNATNTVYVEGIPFDATEREVAHIFRPYPGYKGLRLVEKEKNGKKTFVSFAGLEQAKKAVEEYSMDAVRLLDEIPYPTDEMKELITYLMDRDN